MSDIEKIPSLSELADSIPEVIAPSFTFSFIRLSEDIKIDVPTRLQKDPLIRSLVKYYNSPWHAQENRAPSVLKKYARALDLFFNTTLAEFNYVPDTVGGRWINTLKSVTDSESTIRVLNFSIKSPLDRISKLRLEGMQFTSDEIASVARFNKIWPNPKWNKSDSQKTLEQISPLKHKNIDLFSGLRVFSQWYIQEWASVIHQFKERMPQEYKLIKDDIDRYGDGSFYHQYARKIAKQSIIDREIKRRGTLPKSDRISSLVIWIKAANTLDSDLIKDMVYLAFRSARYENDKNNMGFEEGVGFTGFLSPVIASNRDQYLRSLTEETLGGKLKNPTLPPVTSLMSPSYEMQLSAAWLLASDRHQASNLNLMTLSSIKKINNSLSTIVEISSFKGRNKRTNVNSAVVKEAGEIYKSNHPIHKSLWVYRELVEQGFVDGLFIKDSDALELQLLLPFIPMQAGLPIKKINRYSDSDVGENQSYHLEANKPRYLGFLAAVSSNTVTRTNKKASDISAFVELLEYSMFHNEKTKQRGGGKGGSSPRTGKAIAISPAFIAQTEPVSKRNYDISISDNLSMGSGIMSDDHDFNEIVEAKIANHSPSVRSDVYVNRSNDKVKLLAESKFAEMVGEQMVISAMSLYDIKIEKSNVLTMAEVSAKLGLSEPTKEDSESLEAIMKESNIQDFLIDVTGLMQKDSEIIVIKTPIVAALMISYINHIDKNIEKVILSNENLVAGLIAHRMFLQAMLNEFDEKIKRKAKELFGDADFPFPELIA